LCYGKINKIQIVERGIYVLTVSNPSDRNESRDQKSNKKSRLKKYVAVVF